MKEVVCGEFIHYFVSRFRDDEYAVFLSWYDSKRDNTMMTNHHAIKADISETIKEMYRINVEASVAVSFGLNAYKTSDNRKEANVSRILHIAIDMDENPTIDDFNTMVDWLDKQKIMPAFMSESKNGYHIIIPVDLETADKKYVKQFLENAATIYPKVDLQLIPLSSGIRLPESYHYKSRAVDPNSSGFQLKLFPNTIPTAAQIKRNSEIITSLEIIEKKLEIESNESQDESIVPDVFFNSLFQNENLLKLLSNMQNIQKNHVLFKNMAIYLRNNKRFVDKARLFVASCNHPPDTLKQWMDNQNIKQVNYLELLKWIKNHNIMELYGLIQKQLSQGDILDNFNFFFMLNSKNANVYKVMSERGHLFEEQVSLNHMIKSLYYIMLKDGLCLFEYYHIPVSKQDKEGQDVPIHVADRLKILQTVLLNRINHRTIPISGEQYTPTDDIVFEQNTKLYLNTYMSADVRKQKPLKSDFSFPNIDRVLRHISVDEVNYAWLMKWLAHIVQNPTIKLPTSLVLKGGQGSGKGIFYKFIIKPLFGEDNINQVSTDTFKRGWGDTFQNKLFVNFDEFVLHKGKDDEHIERLKTITSESSVTLNIKGKNSQKMPNYCHFLFTSNKHNPVPLQKDDRRYTIFEQRNAIPLEYVDAIDPVFKEELHTREILHLYSFLLQLPVTYKDVAKALSNETKQDNIESNYNTVDLFLKEINDYDCFNSFYDAYNFETQNAISGERDGIFYKDNMMVITAEKLHDLYSNYCQRIRSKNVMLRNNMGKELKLAGIESLRATRYNKKHTVYVVDYLYLGEAKQKIADFIHQSPQNNKHVLEKAFGVEYIAKCVEQGTLIENPAGCYKVNK